MESFSVLLGLLHAIFSEIARRMQYNLMFLTQAGYLGHLVEGNCLGPFLTILSSYLLPFA